ncbi:MAG: AmmeMemoRadiSam system protein B [Planctomycetaceae bacterium]
MHSSETPTPRRIRPAAVAGRFYPDDPDELQREIAADLPTLEPAEHCPKALIVPHAGYVYSGPVAGSGYARLLPFRETIKRVVLLGPSHHVGFQGLAVSSAEAFATPLGLIPIDRASVERLLQMPQVSELDAAHATEHSLEVHLPFLQRVLDRFVLVPIVVGQTTAEDVAEVIESLWGGDETLCVISSDLSHFHDWATAQRIDRQTADLICERNFEELTPQRACGYLPVSGMLLVARERNLPVELLDLRNSGDTAGGHDRVVGYGSFAIFES